MPDLPAHALHVILAGVWLGGIVFTTTVVAPALNMTATTEGRACAACWLGTCSSGWASGGTCLPS